MNRSRGFTLLELLVVVFIIGVVASFSVIHISGGAQDDRLAQEAQRLSALMQLASETAIMEGVEVGFIADEHSYAFLLLDADLGWSAPADDSPLRLRELPKGMSLALSVDEFALPQADEKDEDEFSLDNERLAEDSKGKDKELTPQIYFLSSEELSPFTVELSAEGTQTRYRILGKESGEIELSAPETATEARSKTDRERR